MTEKFECYLCKRTFDKLWSDDEAYEEAVALMGEKTVKTEEMVTLCDKCYEMALPGVRKELGK